MFGSDFSIFVVAVFIFAILLLVKGVQRVPQGEEWPVERFGRYLRTLTPGLNLIVPFVDLVRSNKKKNMMETVLDVERQEVITKDNAQVTVDGVIFYQVIDAAKAAYEVENYRDAIGKLVMTNIRTVMGSMDLDELLSQRDRINAQLMHVVDSATGTWGVKVTRIEIQDIRPPDALVNSMARQMKAERERRAVILEAEGLRQAAILRAEGEKQAAFLHAEARERAAEAEARATSMVSQAISEGNVQAVNYLIAQQYIEALKSLATAPNQKVLMIPMEMAGVIGAIGGIAEIAREAFPAGSSPVKPPAGGPAAGNGPWQRA